METVNSAISAITYRAICLRQLSFLNATLSCRATRVALRYNCTFLANTEPSCPNPEIKTRYHSVVASMEPRNPRRRLHSHCSICIRIRMRLDWSLCAEMHSTVLLHKYKCRKICRFITTHKARHWLTHIKQQKIRFITSWAVDIIRSSYYILSPWCDGINFCCFICVTQWWALHVVINRHFFLHFMTYMI